MYLDFEENRPDTPRVPPALTRLERFLLAFVAYLAVVVIYLVTPSSYWEKEKPPVPPPDEPIRFVQIMKSLPKPLAVPSRPAASPQPVPTPPPERPQLQPPAEVKTPDPAPPAPSPPLVTPRASPDPPPPAHPPGGILGSALRNLQRDVQNEGFAGSQGNGADDGKSGDIQFDQKGVDFGPWLRRFKAQVYSNWVIPSAAQFLHGHVVITMTIHRDGAITDLRLVQSSNNAAFDNAAMISLKESNPTIPIPADYPGDSISPFTVTFFYNEKIR